MVPATRAARPAPQHDFAALVDRLVEARSAASSAAPQVVSAAVPHAQFGKVSLAFRQDGAGLSVSMTSADPGFAHAAHSAIAAIVLPAVSAQADNRGAQPDANARAHADASSPQTIVAPTHPGRASADASFAGSGGSPPQPQVRLRPARIAAAPQHSGNAAPGTAGASRGPGIFA